MGFPKAVQLVKTPEYLEYVECMLKHKKSCSEHKKICLRYKNSEVKSERIVYLLSKDRHSKISKEYYAAKQRYVIAQAVAEIKHRTPTDMKDMDLLKILGVQIPVSMKDMIKAEKDAAIERSITPEQRKVIEDAARKYMSESQNTRERFMNSFKEESEQKEDASWGFDSPFGTSADENKGE